MGFFWGCSCCESAWCTHQKLPADHDGTNRDWFADYAPEATLYTDLIPSYNLEHVRALSVDDSDGSVYIGGSHGNGTTTPCAEKYDTDGNLLWQHFYNSSIDHIIANSDHSVIVFSTSNLMPGTRDGVWACDPDGNILWEKIVAFQPEQIIASGDSFYTVQGGSILRKFDFASGTEAFSKNYGLESGNMFLLGSSLYRLRNESGQTKIYEVSTTNGDYVSLVGTFNTSPSRRFSGYVDLGGGSAAFHFHFISVSPAFGLEFVEKWTIGGGSATKIWTRNLTAGYSKSQEFYNAIDKDSDGNIYVGMSASVAGQPYYSTAAISTLQKLDSSGAVVWSSPIHERSIYAVDVRQSTGEIYIGGSLS